LSLKSSEKGGDKVNDWKPPLIDGSTPTSTRGTLVNTFQEAEAVRVAVLSIKAAVGLCTLESG
jgi:SNF2 family DNA or RNA helicase